MKKETPTPPLPEEKPAETTATPAPAATAAAPPATPAAPVVAAGKAKKAGKKAAQTSLHLFDWVIIGVVAVGLAYSIFATRNALLPQAGEDLSAHPVATTPPLPQLKLNRNHERQGPDVQVNQNNIGRDNPFTRP